MESRYCLEMLTGYSYLLSVICVYCVITFDLLRLRERVPEDLSAVLLFVLLLLLDRHQTGIFEHDNHYYCTVYCTYVVVALQCGCGMSQTTIVIVHVESASIKKLYTRQINVIYRQRKNINRLVDSAFAV